MFAINDPVLVFTILMLIFLAAPLLAEKLKVPELVLLLLAGYVLGPNALGMMERGGGIELFGSIGLIYIMFNAGLEVDTNHFRQVARRSGAFGMITFLIPQTVGIFVGYYIFRFDLLTSILLASMFASHTLIAYPIASRFGISRNEAVMITVGGTILTDTLALLVLAVIANYSKGEELGVKFWLLMLSGMAALTFGIWYVLPRIACRFFRNISEKGNSQVVFVLGMVCMCAYWSHYAKLEPIIGAFLAGVAFNRLIPAQSTLMNRLIFVGNTFFIPFFLISVGMLIKPQAMFSTWNGALVAIVMSATVIGTKYLAAQLTGVWFHYTRPERKVMFGLSVAQAAATLAAVLVGYELKIFNEDVLNGAIVMIMITCPMGCYYVEKYGRQTGAEFVPVKFGINPEQRILVAVSQPRAAAKLLDLTFMLRNPALQGEIFPVTVVNELESASVSAGIAKGEKLLAECISLAAALEVPLSPGIRLAHNTADGLARAVQEYRCDLMMVGWSDKITLKSRIFGSFADNLLESCAGRMWFCRLKTPLNTCRRVILPLPEFGGQRKDFALLLRDVRQLAGQIGAELRVVVPPEISPKAERLIQKQNSECRFELVKIEAWRKSENEFINELKADDILVLPLERRESVLWQPRFERFEDLAIARYPEINLIAAYPQTMDGEEDGSGRIPSVDDEKGTIFHGVDLKAPEMTSAIEVMVRSELTKLISAQSEVLSGLQEALRYHPLELSDSALLLHTRSEHVLNCMVLVGFSEKPYRLRDMPGEYKIVVALISPTSGGQELHLCELANLARHFMNPELVNALKQVHSASEVVDLLKK